MNALVIATAVVCLFRGTFGQHDPTYEVTYNSGSSSADGVLGCPFKPAQGGGNTIKVRFQALQAGGVEYTRVMVPEERMSFMDVDTIDLGTLDIKRCSAAASDQQLDAFALVEGQCMGYNIGDGICPCTTGDILLYRAPTALRNSVTSRASPVPMNREDVPAGYTRKIIYPTISMTDGYESMLGTCEDAYLTFGPSLPALMHYVSEDDQCYFTNDFTDYDCATCLGPATEVIIKDNIDPIIMTSLCGQNITAVQVPQYATDPEKFILSHDGYGCIPYPEPSSEEDCVLTVMRPSGTNEMHVFRFPNLFDIDSSGDTSCSGDEMYLYAGTAEPENVIADFGDPCVTTQENLQIVTTDRVTIKFHRSPNNNQDGSHKGFAVGISALLRTRSLI